MNTESTLFLIPARGGSKGIPGKNIKPLCGKPLLLYTIEAARAVADDADICVSTDSPQIRAVAQSAGLDVPFLRPAELSADNSGSHEVMLHALDFYRDRGVDYHCVVLLQPTSPFRTPDDIRGAMALFDEDTELVVSVTEAATNPYYNCYELDEAGFLHISKGDGILLRRQDAPPAYEYNGAVYVISTAALRRHPIGKMTRRRPFLMPKERSVDLDTPLDWIVAEMLMAQLNH